MVAMLAWQYKSGRSHRTTWPLTEWLCMVQYEQELEGNA